MEEPLKCLENLLLKSSLEQKRMMLSAISSSIALDESNLVPPVLNQSTDMSGLVEHIPDLGLEDEHYWTIRSELESMNLSGKGRGVKNQWLSPTDEYYNYSSVINKPKPISDYPGICKLMDLVNNHESTTGDLDCCLVTRFPTAATKLGLHRDNDSLMSQTSDICVVSFGAPRQLEIVMDSNKSKKGPILPDIILPAVDRSMNVMKAGSQSLMRHRVARGQFSPDESEERFSISFRKIVPSTSSDSSSINSASTSASVIQDTEKDCPKKNIILIAGDSFAARLDVKRLGKGKVEVQNIAVGGRKIMQVENDITHFLQNNPDVNIKKLFISIGTNDIRNCRNGVKHLKQPIASLMKKVKSILPGTLVWIQSIPPLNPNNCPYTCRNVLDMNNLLYDSCARHKMFYLDIFNAFLDYKGHINSHLFPKFDTVKQLFDIHPNARGMGVLARFYIFIIHSKWFNPMGY